MFNFNLKKLDNIIPIGKPGDLRISWFWLTEGELWIDLGEATLYEYSDQAMVYFKNKLSPFNDYYIVRFIEDFSILFNHISENVPKPIFDITTDLLQFDNEAEQWLDLNETDDNRYSNFYFKDYQKLISWRWDRNMNSGHLKGGPNISFFRNEDIIRILWKSDGKLENGIKIWKFENGYCDMDYGQFVQEIQKFKDDFFKKMLEQVKISTQKDWGAIKIDKERLVQEHFERENDFQNKLDLLKNPSTGNRDWKAIEVLVRRMKKEINQV